MTGVEGRIAQWMAHSANSLVEGFLIAAAAWLVLRLTGTRNSGVRFAVWFSALLAMAGLFAVHGPAGAAATSRLPEIVIPGRWALYLLYGWSAVAFLGLVRVGAGLWRLRVLREDSSPLDVTTLSPVAQANWRELNLLRPTVIFVSDHVRVPTAIGFLRPAVLLPAWTLKELSSEELEIVLLHEFAHLRRWDDWTNLAQKIIRALLFFHPAVWWVDNRLSLEREMSCDDLVLAHLNNPRGYAQCLVTLAEQSFLRRPVALAQAAVARMKHTAERITKILDGAERKVVPAWKPALGAFAAFAIMSAVALEHTPQLVGFENAAQPGTGASVQHQSSNSSPRLAAASSQSHEVVPIKRTAHPRVMSIPASYSAKKATPEPATVIASASLPRRENETRRQTMEEAGADDFHPQVTNARANDDASPQFMLVVFETQECDADGGITIKTYVWRIRVLKPTDVRTLASTDPRAT